VLELVALGALIGVLLLLSGLPTNWLAVLVLVLGVLGFLTVPFVSPRWARVAEIGLVLQALGGFFLFNGLQVSVLLIAVTIGLSLLYHRFGLLPLLRRARQQAAVVGDDDQLIGASGRVVKAFDAFGKQYIGTITVGGEQWTATSAKPLQPGDAVLVVERDGLQLAVEGLKYKVAPQNNHYEEA
jgi:membrane-bound ClpP family serine protease